MPHFSQQLLKFLLDLLFPAFCLECKKEGTFLCTECRRTIQRQSEQVCPFCYKISALGLVCEGCKTSQNCALDGILVVARFEEKSLLQRCIHNFKYESLRDLGNELAQLLVEVLNVNPLKNVVLCPVPLHPKRFRWRGFNQSEILAKIVQKNLPVPMFQLLERTSFVAPQMELSREERKENVINAFALNHKTWKDFTSRHDVLLIDDVCTTASTLEASARVLKNNGIEKVYALVLARAY